MNIRKLLLLFIIVLGSFLSGFSQLEKVADIGWLVDSDGGKLSIGLIADNERPVYIQLPGTNDSGPCLIPLKGMNDLRKYLKEVIKTAKELDQFGRDSVAKSETRIIEAVSPKVMMSWNGDRIYNNDEVYEGWSPLSANWEFYRNIDGKSGSYILLSTRISTHDPDEFRDYRLFLPLKTLEVVLNKLISKRQVDSIVNGYINDESAKRMSRERIQRR